MRNFRFNFFSVSLRIGTEVRINMMISCTIIFMKRWCFKNRIKINCTDAKIFEIIQFIDYSLQITSVSSALNIKPNILSIFLFIWLKPIPIRIPGMNLPRRSMIMRPGTFYIFNCGIIIRITISKTFRKNLVPNNFLCPFRHKVILIH